MISDSKSKAALALHRFGLGPRAGSILAVASDPRGALLAELERPYAQIDPKNLPKNLMSSADAARAVFRFEAERSARQIAARREAERQRAMAGGETDKPAASNAEAGMPGPPSKPEPNVPREIVLNEAKARFDAAIAAEIGFTERLVWFWSNHFCVSAEKVPSMAGSYEREAIRPHVLGRFADMLLAVESHAAMLFYLDNHRSIGPDSVAGITRNRGLNENLAREILELHTLGVHGGYTQDDVTRFANVITGWTIIPFQGNPEHASEFVFNPHMHQPGAQIVIGKNYAQTGIEQGRAVLTDLARHPATAEHISFKLARHFVADQPPAALVERVARTFRATDGDLKEMARALISAPESWDSPRSKLKRPSEWMVAGLRAAGAREPNITRVMQAHALLGEPLWRPPAPKGFSDEESAWIDGLPARLDIANAFANRVGDLINPHTLVEETLGPLASAETRQTVARAETKAQAFALLLMSPEFQRR